MAVEPLLSTRAQRAFILTGEHHNLGSHLLTVIAFSDNSSVPLVLQRSSPLTVYNRGNRGVGDGWTHLQKGLHHL